MTNYDRWKLATPPHLEDAEEVEDEALTQQHKRIIEFCREPKTLKEVAEFLKISEPAARKHLLRLRGFRLLKRIDSFTSKGRPLFQYVITDEAIYAQSLEKIVDSKYQRRYVNPHPAAGTVVLGVVL